MKKKLLLVFIVLGFLLPNISFAYSKIVAFGDSLSDTGNVYTATNGATPGFPSYFFGRYSNGPVWVEYLADNIGATLENYAWGGATTSGMGSVPGLDLQVAGFLSSGSFDNNTLFTVWAGPNDFFQGATNPFPSVNNIISSVMALETAGAKHILIPNMPDLGITPMALALPPANQAGLTALTNMFNSYLHTELTALLNPGFSATLYELNVQQIMYDIIAGGTFGNTTEGCYLANGLNAWGLAGEYVFWDGVHPTTKAHMILADYAAAEATTSVPIPATLWMLGSGLMFIAGIKRKA